MNTKSKHKKFKLWTQKKSKYSNTESEYFSNLDIWTYRYLSLNYKSR